VSSIAASNSPCKEASLPGPSQVRSGQVKLVSRRSGLGTPSLRPVVPAQRTLASAVGEHRNDGSAAGPSDDGNGGNVHSTDCQILPSYRGHSWQTHDSLYKRG
jgi:hypothetical protein